MDELVEAFAEAKRRFYRDDLRPSEIEGARFSEAVFRILEWATTQTYTPLGKDLPKVPSLIGRLEQVATSGAVTCTRGTTATRAVGARSWPGGAQGGRTGPGSV